MKIREALLEDLESIITLIADDDLGKTREDFRIPLPEFYVKAFHEILHDKNNELIVVELYDQIIGTFQLTFIPNLTFKGGRRCQIEGVRVHKNFQGQGIGQKMFQWAIERAKEKECHLIQLTTNKKRDKAKDFYDQFGFKASHEGMKLYL